MLINIEGGEYRHALVCCQIVFEFWNSLKIIFFIWLLWALLEIELEHFLIVNGLAGVQQNYRAFLDLLFVSWGFDVKIGDWFSEGLDAVEPSARFKDEFVGWLAGQIIGLAFYRQGHFWSRHLLQVFQNSIICIAVAGLIFLHEDVLFQLLNPLGLTAEVFGLKPVYDIHLLLFITV